MAGSAYSFLKSLMLVNVPVRGNFLCLALISLNVMGLASRHRLTPSSAAASNA